MRQLDANSTASLIGSRPGDTLTVWAWYNGQPALPDPLKVADWALSYDTTRQIQTLSLTVADTDGTLAPWLLEDPLGVAGTRLQVYYNVGGAGSVAYDWFRISESNPAEQWRSYTVSDSSVTLRDSPITPGHSIRYASGGAQITIKAETLTRNIANAQFLAPTSPYGTNPTSVGEIKHLLADIMPVTVLPGVTDVPIPTTFVHPQDRLNAVQDLAKRMNADIRTNGAGVLEVYPLVASPVWTLAPGRENYQIDVSRQMKLDGLYNVFVVDGTGSGSNQKPIRGIARITSGALRDGGPHGSFPVFYSSNLIATQADADAYAIAMRDTQLRGLIVPLVATCLPDPRLQQGDWITVTAVTTAPAKSTISFPAKIRTLDLKGKDGTTEAMVLGLDASYSDVSAVFSGVARS